MEVEIEILEIASALVEIFKFLHEIESISDKGSRLETLGRNKMRNMCTAMHVGGKRLNALQLSLAAFIFAGHIACAVVSMSA